MAKRPKPTPARKASARNDSLLLRSAESLGRMIGALQRQLDVATRERVSPAETPNGKAKRRRAPASSKAAKSTKKR